MSNIREFIKLKLNENLNNKPDTWVPCPRCGGSGQLMHYLHIDAGKCYECGGKGIVPNFAVPEIKEKMRLAQIKKDEKNKETAKLEKEKTDQRWKNMNEYAIDFNNKILDKVILPRIDMSKFQARKDFEQMEKFADHLKITNGEEFIKNMKPIFKIMFDPHFQYQMAKYLKDKYNYDYIKPNTDFNDYYSVLPPDIRKTIEALQDKYRSTYENLGRV